MILAISLLGGCASGEDAPDIDPNSAAYTPAATPATADSKGNDASVQEDVMDETEDSGGVDELEPSEPEAEANEPEAEATEDVTPAPAPSVQFRAEPSDVVQGASTTLTWSATSADGCTASTGWSGSKPAAGSEVVGPLGQTTTFTLTCSGPGGIAVEMLSVELRRPLAVRWMPPTANVDGTSLDDLAGFQIYFGLHSRRYLQAVAVDDPTATSHLLMLIPATYFIAMTAVDADGNESGYSNEIVEILE